MKPKPFSPLNHLTVPVAMVFSLSTLRATPCGPRVTALIALGEIRTSTATKTPDRPESWPIRRRKRLTNQNCNGATLPPLDPAGRPPRHRVARGAYGRCRSSPPEEL